MKLNLILGKLSYFLYNKTKLWLVGLLFLLLALMFLFLPIYENYLKINVNMISLDKPNIYSSAKTYEILTEWGESGRTKQFWFHITWDLLLPIIYFFFLGFLISWLTKRGFNRDSKKQMFNLVSLVAVIDLLENIFLIALILIYPSNIPILSWIKTSLTLIKYYFFGPAIFFTLLGSTVYAFKNRFIIQE